ncbi:MAG: EAL and HDOD domain-containing protein [Thermodesulfobacteriota bacterium]
MATEQPNIFIARQPIFRRNQKVFAYELLYRAGLVNAYDPNQDGEQATSKVITNSFLMIGIATITEGKRAFINFSEEMLLQGYPGLFPKDLVVVEVLETVGTTPEVVKACEGLVRKGYVLALDDFLYDDRFLPLIRLSKIIKFDIRQMEFAELERQVEIVKRQGVKLLAEKIETKEEFEATKSLGFDLFQGYFFSKPNIVQGRDIPGSKLQYLKILRMLQDENCDFPKLAGVINHDVSLAYKLLKYVNSAYFARINAARSTQEAVSMLGELHLRKWLSLMMLSYLAEDKPSELLRMSAFRGSLCELIAGQLLGRKGEQAAFHTVGMFSLLPALLDKPMAEVVRELPLGPSVIDALLDRGVSPLHQTLSLVEAYERGNWVEAGRLVAGLGVRAEHIPLLYAQSLEIVQSYGFTD